MWDLMVSFLIIAYLLTLNKYRINTEIINRSSIIVISFQITFQSWRVLLRYYLILLKRRSWNFHDYSYLRNLKLLIRANHFFFFLSVAWPTGVQLLVFFCSSVPVMLFSTSGISGCRSQHVPVESTPLLYHNIYL